MKKDDLITRCKLLKGERDESIFTILIGIVVKLGLVGLAFYLLLGSTVDSHLEQLLRDGYTE
ncbi:hypothetical protein QR053_23670 [Salmonella enterica]|nr:hypothetical protein [Salmonella enterica]